MMRLMMFGLVLLAAALAVPVATANPPVRASVLAPEEFTLDGVCSFSVGFHVLVNRETTTTFADGSQLITGSFTDQITNLSDPTKTLIDNNSGPITLTPNPDGSLSVKVTGQGGVFFFPGQLGPGSPGQFLLTNGLFQEQVSPTGDIVPGSVSYKGKPPTDICIALA